MAEVTAERAPDAGFSLIEVLVCVALLTAACVAGLGVVPTLVHGAQRAIVRDAATNLARLAIERARAATAYYPASGYSANHTYALGTSASYSAAVRVHRTWCNAHAPTTDIAMDVALAYDAALDTVTATVSYPRDPCDVTRTDRVVVSASLGPSAWAPGSTVTTAIGDPTQQ
jgi:prepilin-type N-terminal cleavage/methylation domain-containing protein